MNNKLRMLVTATVVLVIAVIAWLMLPRPSGAPRPPPPSGPSQPVQVETPRLPSKQASVPTPSLLPPSTPSPAVQSQRPPGKDLANTNASPAVMSIVGLGAAKNGYADRAKALRSLSRQLTETDAKALMAFLGNDFESQKPLRPLELSSIKSDILDILLKQDRIPAGLEAQVVEMYRDHGHDDVWRDYCVQYFAACYEATKPTGVTTNEPDRTREDIRKAYQEALAEKGKSIAGTALIGVEQLSRTHPEFDRKMVEEAALAFSSADDCGEATRITAVRLCAAMGKKEVVPTVRVLAQTGDSVMLRMAAVATLGDLGNKEDMELLRSLAMSSEKRITGVSSSAVVRLARRLAAETGTPQDMTER